MFMADFDYSSLRIVARGLRFPEGPVAFDDGRVLVAEIEGGSVATIAPDGSVTRIECGGGPNGAARGPDGAIYVCNDGGLIFQTTGDIRGPYGVAPDFKGGSIQRVDLSDGSVSTVFAESGGQAIGGLNDIVFDAAGGAWIVDTTRCSLHYADPLAGTIAVAAEGVMMPNGAGLSPDGQTLYVSETFSGNVLAWDVAGPGRLENRRTLFSIGAGSHAFDGRLDGLAIDGAGNVCVASLGDRSGITVISPEGEELGLFKTPEPDPFVTNICFGGPDGDTAYICSAGRGILYAIKWPWPGLRLHCTG
jgi:gluconolactonase